MSLQHKDLYLPFIFNRQYLFTTAIPHEPFASIKNKIRTEFPIDLDKGKIYDSKGKLILSDRLLANYAIISIECTGAPKFNRFRGNIPDPNLTFFSLLYSNLHHSIRYQTIDSSMSIVDLYYEIFRRERLLNPNCLINGIYSNFKPWKEGFHYSNCYLGNEESKEISMELDAENILNFAHLKIIKREKYDFLIQMKKIFLQK